MNFTRLCGDGNWNAPPTIGGLRRARVAFTWARSTPNYRPHPPSPHEHGRGNDRTRVADAHARLVLCSQNKNPLRQNQTTRNKNSLNQNPNTLNGNQNPAETKPNDALLPRSCSIVFSPSSSDKHCVCLIGTSAPRCTQLTLCLRLRSRCVDVKFICFWQNAHTARKLLTCDKRVPNVLLCQCDCNAT